MANLNGKHLYKTLKCLDIDTGTVTSESLDWLFDNKETSSILTWLCTYVNDNNIETCQELQELEMIKNEENIEPSAEYINNLYDSNPKFSAILEVNPQQITTLKREIENAKAKEDHLNKLTCKYLSLENKLNLQIRKLQDDEMNLRIKQDMILTKCDTKSKNIDKLHNNIFSSVEELSLILSNYNSLQNKYFFCQMPLEKYKQQWESLNTNLNLWIRKQIEVNNSFNIQNNDKYIMSEIGRMKYTIEESLINYVKSECAETELKSRWDYLRNNTYSKTSVDNLRIQEIQITSRINSIHEDLNRLYSTDLQQSVEKHTMNHLNIFLIKNAENKLFKCKETLKMLKSINNETNHALAQFQLIFLLLKTDKVKIQTIEKFLEDIYFYSSKYLKNYTLRSKLMKEIELNVSKQKPFLTETFEILTEKYNEDSVMTTIKQFEKKKVQIENLENQIFVIENQKYWNSVKEMEQNLRLMKEFIWNGPTLQPVIIPYNYLQNISTANLQIEKVYKMLGTSMDNYKQIRTRIEKNRWLKYRRLLWALFLMKPQKMTEVIENLREFVTEQARNNV